MKPAATLQRVPGAVRPVSCISGTHNLAAAIVCTESGISAVSVTLVGPAQSLI